MEINTVSTLVGFSQPPPRFPTYLILSLSLFFRGLFSFLSFPFFLFLSSLVLTRCLSSWWHHRLPEQFTGLTRITRRRHTMNPEISILLWSLFFPLSHSLSLDPACTWTFKFFKKFSIGKFYRFIGSMLGCISNILDIFANCKFLVFLFQSSISLLQKSQIFHIPVVSIFNFPYPCPINCKFLEKVS